MRRLCVIEAFGLSVPQSLAEVCDPRRCAVILYDMQAGIVPQIGEGQQVLRHCQELLQAARARGFRIFFARHMFLPHRAAGVGQLRRSMIWQRQEDPLQLRPMITYGSDAWQIVPELAPRADEVMIDKITMSAFEGTFLDIAMRDAHLDAFVIAGIAMEVGIEPTVRHALDRNYIPVVVTDACGSKEAELKERSLKTLAQTGEVLAVSTAEVVAAMA
ncbi:cysteine hydrolase [Acidobacteria bacterium AB60]|nr:cysteine hydrolase [Acidobacteria bacterium AB60]